MKQKLLFIYLLFFSLGSFAQFNVEVEKLEKEISDEKNELKKIDLLNTLSQKTSSNYFEKTFANANEALRLSTKLNYVNGKIKAFDNIGDAYWYQGNYNKAETYYFEAYKLNDSIKNEVGLARSMYNMGWILCLQQGRSDKLHYLLNSLKVYEKIKDPRGILDLNDALGIYYSNLYRNTKNEMFLDSSIYYYKKAIAWADKFPLIVGETYANYALLLINTKDTITAKTYFEKSLKIALINGDSTNVYFNNIQLAGILVHAGEIDKGINLLKQAIAFSARTGIKNLTLYCNNFLQVAYYRKGNYQLAYDYLQAARMNEDSTNAQLVRSRLNSFQNTYDSEKKEADIRALKQANEIQELKSKQNRYFLIGAIGVALVVLVIAYLLFQQNRHKTEVNHLLKEQNVLISHKKQEIENSIQYAKGIQNALLPNPADIVNNLKQSFIFYQPKDVVSGDFYWFHEVGNYFYCIAADCTGHGVPGALMSIVSMDKLHQAVFEKKITEPCDILSFLNIEIKNALKQHSDHSKQKDGLDLALLRFNKDLSSLVYAGANRPLYHIKQGVLREYKANKTAIAGFTPNDYHFEQQTVALHAGDCLYITSDGYADQFGGPGGKKFMTKNFKALLESVSAKDINSQKREVIDGFNAWKGNYEQVDDILVIGIKI